MKRMRVRDETVEENQGRGGGGDEGKRDSTSSSSFGGISPASFTLFFSIELHTTVSED